MNHYEIRRIGKNRGAPRIWIEGRQAEQAGFAPGSAYGVQIERDRKTLILSQVDTGPRRVSRRERNGRALPIIDLNSIEALSMFEGMQQVRVIAGDGVIYILPLASEARKAERVERIKAKLRQGQPLSMGSLSHGGGVLSMALHEGMRVGGVDSHLSFANDVRPDLLEHASRVNPVWSDQTVALAAPMQELVFDHWSMQRLQPVDCLEAGIPCTGASLSGRAKNGTSCAEAHPDVGHLVVAFLAVIAKVNPAVIVLENVVPYQSTASMHIIRNQLRDMGYELHESVLDGADFNALEHRKRMCMVAVTEGMDFNWEALQKPEPRTRRLGEILEDVADDDPRWSEMGYLRDKQVRDKAAGKGFAMQILDGQANKVGTVGTGYQKNRSTEPKVQHHSRPELLRLLTPREHAACKDIPERLIQGLSATTAHEVLGQSIVYSAFVAVGQQLAQTLTAWESGAAHDSAPADLLQAA